MERIPQVKPVRRRKANRRALVFLALFFLSLATFLFVRSPYSKIHAVHVTGTHLLSPGEVIRQSGLVPGHTLILFSADRVRERLARLPEVKETAVAWRWPNEVEIAVTERAVLAYVVQNGQHVPLLEGGVLLFHRAGKGPYVDLPLVTRWEEPRRLPQLAAGLTKLPAAVRERLSEIQLVPTAAIPIACASIRAKGLSSTRRWRTWRTSWRPCPSSWTTACGKIRRSAGCFTSLTRCGTRGRQRRRTSEPSEHCGGAPARRCERLRANCDFCAKQAGKGPLLLNGTSNAGWVGGATGCATATFWSAWTSGPHGFA